MLNNSEVQQPNTDQPKVLSQPEAEQPLGGRSDGDSVPEILERLELHKLGWGSAGEYLLHRSGLISHPQDPLAHLPLEERTGDIYSGGSLGLFLWQDLGEMLLEHPDWEELRGSLKQKVGPRRTLKYMHEVTKYRANIKRVVDVWRSRGIL